MKIHCGKRKAFLSVTNTLVSLLFFTSLAVAEKGDRWRLYYTVPNVSQHFYDSRSIVQTSKTVTKKNRARIARSRKISKKAWIAKVNEKIVFNKPDCELKESKVLREFDCSAKKVHTLMRSNVYRNGTLQIKGKLGIWQGIDSEPQLETLRNFVCPP